MMQSFVKAVLLGGALFNTACAIAVRGFTNATALPTASTSTSKSTITSMSSPSAITAAANASMCTSDYGFGEYSGYTDMSLRCYCASMYMAWRTTTNPPTRTITIAQESGSTTETITTFSSTITTVVEYVTTEIETLVGNFDGAVYDPWPGTAVSPCCSSCTIAAQTVNIFYWPTPALPNQATELVNSDGFTFVSPTVYLGFASMYASDLCGNVGNVYTSTTFEFGPSELSTIGSPSVTTSSSTQYVEDNNGKTFLTDTIIETIDFAGPATILDYRDLGQNCSTIAGYNYVAGSPQQDEVVTYDPCHPTIVLPAKVKSADPAWASCVNNLIGGFYDPPYTLTVGGALQAFSAVSAAPAHTPQSVQAPSTTSSPIQPTIAPPAEPVSQSSPSPQPPSNSDPAPPIGTPATPQVPPVASSNYPLSDTPNLPSPTNSQLVPTDPAKPPTLPTSTNPAPTDPIDPGTPKQSAPIQYPGIPLTSTAPQAAVIIGSQSLKPGGPPVTVSGTELSLDPSGNSVIINGESTLPLTQIVTIQSQATIGSQILVAGGSQITVSGVMLSLLPSGGVVVNDASTIPVSSLEAEISAIISAPAVLSTPTLVPGGSPITVDGTTYLLEPTGNNVIINGISTIPLLSANAVISSAAASETQMLLPGGPPITVGGTTYSLQPTGSNVVVDGISTIPLSRADALISSAATLEPQIQTLIPGGYALTIGGTKYSLQPMGDNVVVNSVSTIPLSSADAIISSAVDGRIGPAIASIVGATPTATTVIGGSTFVLEGSSTVSIASPTGPLQFTGNGMRVEIRTYPLCIFLLTLIVGFVLFA